MCLKISKIHTLLPWLLHSGLKSLYSPMLFSSLCSHIFLVLYPSVVLSYVAQSMVYFSSLTWMTVVQSLLSLCLMPVLLTWNITFIICFHFFLNKNGTNCVLVMVVPCSFLSIQYKYLNYILSKIYGIRWEICLPAYPPSVLLCCLFHLKKCCRNLALKQKNITEIFFCLTGA